MYINMPGFRNFANTRCAIRKSIMHAALSLCSIWAKEDRSYSFDRLMMGECGPTTCLMFHRDVTDDEFQQLVGQLKSWGVAVFVYHRRDNMRHLNLKTR